MTAPDDSTQPCVPIDVTPSLTDYLRPMRGPHPSDATKRSPVQFGVTADLEGAQLSIELVFLRGRHYCCMEPGCHLGLFDGARWVRLRECLVRSGVTAPPQLSLRLSVIVEEGTLLFDMWSPDPEHHGYYAFAPHDGQRYEDVRHEGSASA